MYDKERLQILEPIMKPLSLEAIISLDKLFSDINYTAYEARLDNIMSVDIGGPNDISVEVESLYINACITILSQMGVSLQNQDELDLVTLSTLINAMQDLVEPENADLVADNLDAYEDGQAFLVNVLEVITDEPMGRWLSVIESFDVSSIIGIKQLLNEELTYAEKEAVASYRTRAKKGIALIGKENVPATYNFISSREMGEEFGFSFIIATQFLWDTLINFNTAQTIHRLRDELLALALASSLDFYSIKPEIESLLERMDIDLLLRVKLLSDVEAFLLKFEGEKNEQA